MKKFEPYEKVSIVFLIVVIAICIIIHIGNNNIVGEWESESGIKFEFFSDGTYSSSISMFGGNYTFEKNRLKLDVLWSNVTYDAKLSGNTLTIDMDGEEVVLKRQNKLGNP